MDQALSHVTRRPLSDEIFTMSKKISSSFSRGRPPVVGPDKRTRTHVGCVFSDVNRPTAAMVSVACVAGATARPCVAFGNTPTGSNNRGARRANQVAKHVPKTSVSMNASGTNNTRSASGKGFRRSISTQISASSNEGKDTGRGGGLGKLLGGLLLGAGIGGAIGVLFAPQLSKTFLKGKDAAGRFLYDDWENSSDDDGDLALERTRNDLNEKIAQLNAAIDTFSSEADKQGQGAGDGDGEDDGESYLDSSAVSKKNADDAASDGTPEKTASAKTR